MTQRAILQKLQQLDQTSLENYLKAEELAAKEPDSSPDKWYFIRKINGEKFQIYSRQGKTAEAQKASETMGVAGAKYRELTQNDTSFDFGCLIATATFDSALSPQVQQLREFREHTIYSTKSGAQFMTAFNAWYYSFSPAVAKFINDNPATKAPMQVVLTPLLGILTLAQMSYSMVSFNPDIAVVVSGLVAGTLIGVVYAFPGTACAAFWYQEVPACCARPRTLFPSRRNRSHRSGLSRPGRSGICRFGSHGRERSPHCRHRIHDRSFSVMGVPQPAASPISTGKYGIVFIFFRISAGRKYRSCRMT